MAKAVIPITEARKNLFRIAEEVQKPEVVYMLTEHGKPKVVIMSSEEFESWVETFEILSNPVTMKDIKKGKADIQAGRIASLEEVEKRIFKTNKKKSKKT